LCGEPPSEYLGRAADFTTCIAEGDTPEDPAKAADLLHVEIAELKAEEWWE
jgi:hypothetical protein